MHPALQLLTKRNVKEKKRDCKNYLQIPSNGYHFCGNQGYIVIFDALKYFPLASINEITDGILFL